MTMATNPTSADRVVAISGGANFLGAGLTQKLLDDPRTKKVVLFDTRQPPSQDGRLVYYKVDMTLPSASQIISKILANEHVDTFCHLIFSFGLSRSRSIAHEIEAIGTMHMLDACEAAGVRKVVARSTTAIYGAKPKGPAFYTENHPVDTDARNSMVTEKLETERQLQVFAQRHPDKVVTILRACTTMGPTAINFLSNMLIQPRAVKLIGYDPLMQFVHEEDLYRAYKKVIDEDHPGVYNIVGKGTLRYSEVLDTMETRPIPMPLSAWEPVSSVLWSLKLSDIPDKLTRYLQYPWVADGTKAVQEIGFIPEFSSRDALLAAYHVHRKSKN